MSQKFAIKLLWIFIMHPHSTPSPASQLLNLIMAWSLALAPGITERHVKAGSAKGQLCLNEGLGDMAR